MAPLLCECPGPDEQCPNKAKEKSVQVGWGDLNLCAHCNQLRREQEQNQACAGIDLLNKLESTSSSSDKGNSLNKQIDISPVLSQVPGSGVQSEKGVNLRKTSTNQILGNKNIDPGMLYQPLLGYILL